LLPDELHPFVVQCSWIGFAFDIFAPALDVQARVGRNTVAKAFFYKLPMVFVETQTVVAG